jgi:hypothetical protein
MYLQGKKKQRGNSKQETVKPTTISKEESHVLKVATNVAERPKETWMTGSPDALPHTHLSTICVLCM